MATFAALNLLDSIGRYHRPGPVLAANPGLPLRVGMGGPMFNPLVSANLGGGGYSGSQIQVIATDRDTVEAVREGRREDEERDRSNTAAVAGGVAIICLAGVAAFVVKMCCNSTRELNEAVAFRDNQFPHLVVLDQEAVNPILTAHIKDLETKAFWSRNFVILTVAVLGSAVAAFVGGMCSIPWLITAAVVGGVFTLATGVFAGVWYMMEDGSAVTPEMLGQLDVLRAEIRARQGGAQPDGAQVGEPGDGRHVHFTDGGRPGDEQPGAI